MLLGHDMIFWMIAVLAVMIVGISKAGFGGAVGAIATPLIALVMPVSDAAALLLPLLLVADVFTVQHYHKTFDKPSLQVLLPGAIAGIILGALMFTTFSHNERTLKIMIGVIAVAFVLFQTLKPYMFKSLKSHQPSNLWGVLLGITTGFTSTLAHVGGPPATMYLLPKQLPRNVFVGTNALLFFSINLLKLIPYALLGLLSVGNLAVTLTLLPFVFLGTRLGVSLNRNFNDLWFNRVIYTFLFITGLELMFDFNLFDVVLLSRF